MSASDARWLALIAAASIARVAAADPAEDAFRKGRDLMKRGSYADACAAFEDSQRLDPSFGTQFNIAQCDEKIGKLATALKIFRELAQADTNAARKAASGELGGKLEPRVPKLQLQIEPRAPGLAIVVAGETRTCGADACGGNLPIDFGTHAIVARAPGFRDATARVTVSEEGKIIVVPIHLEPAPAAPVPVITRPPAEAIATVTEPPARSHRRTYATIALAGGGAALATGVVFGLLARSKWSDARAVCGGDQTCPTDAETQRATALGDAAQLRANVSTALVLAGAVAGTAGVVLWLTSPHAEHTVAVSATGTAVTLSGRF